MTTAANKPDLDQLAINTIRFLAVDMVEKAASGHPGAPLGQAPMAYLLWTRFLRHDPADPAWPDRDRFVLSCGHASALLYALLHLSGYDLPVEELQRFRQLGSKTPGHPEHGLTEGVETTTGPLGQGLGNAVGMAIAQRLLATRFNRPGLPIFGHRIWVFVSDGDLMEGVASEASSLAGHLRLAPLKVFYDDNHITIDGSTELAFSDEVCQRYESYGWNVLRVRDGNDLASLTGAFEAAEAENERPTLVAVRTHIGYGSPKKQDTASAHGEPLGGSEVEATKKNLGWPLEPAFLVPEEALAPFREAAARGAEARREWQAKLDRFAREHPEAGAELAVRRRGELPPGWDADLPAFRPEDGEMATRQASGAALNALAKKLPELVGGSADLAPSNNTMLKGEPAFSATEPGGRNFHFGVREHAMGSALNGMALSGLLRPYGGTFLIFSDYMRPAIRLAALMELPVVYVFTHDSIFLGEDGPTHQPVSQLLSLRSIPHLTVLRPADANETVAAWKVAIENREGPTALALTRQKLPILGDAERIREGVPRGAYVLSEAAGGEPQVILIASGSEVSLVLDAQKALAVEGIHARVVSFPSWQLFDAQDQTYRETVLPPSVRHRLAVEAATPIGWHKYVGDSGEVLGQETFGASAPYKDLAKHFGYTVEAVVGRVKGMLAGS